MENVQGNVSTVVVMLWTILSPYISQYVTQEVFVAACGLILVIWSAYNPNTFKIFNNNIKPAVSAEYEEGLNQEYTVGEDDGE